jgi:hypothetical protein
MNVLKPRQSSVRSSRLFRGGVVTVTVIALAIPAAACGGGGSVSPGVASVGSTTSSTSAASTSANAAQLDKYGACMRSHGMPQYQNPTDTGNQISFPGVNFTSPQYLKAQAACGKLLPAGLVRQPGGTVPAADQGDYLKAAACIRSHGFATYPDPTFTGGVVHLPTASGIDENSPQFQKALATCRKLIPAGLPYGS